MQMNGLIFAEKAWRIRQKLYSVKIDIITLIPIVGDFVATNAT